MKIIPLSTVIRDLAAKSETGCVVSTKKIFFEDRGQDFLWWVVDDKGAVIDCGPFQATVWTKCTVLNHDRLFVGGGVLIKTPQEEKPLTINYLIESIETLKAKKPVVKAAAKPITRRRVKKGAHE
jgi:hypothetical protein